MLQVEYWQHPAADAISLPHYGLLGFIDFQARNRMLVEQDAYL